MFAEGSEWQPEGEDSLCESCGQEPATVHVLRVQGGDVTQSHLCHDCAGEMAQQSEGPALVFAVPLASSGVHREARADHGGRGGTVGDPGQRCATCGTTLTDVTETGLVGCAACYQTFAAHLARPGGVDAQAVSHLGKIPSRAPEGVRTRREIVRLTRMLGELVESERYEEAARVRDRLVELGHRPAGSDA
jgi:protein arginine kinase activator